MPLSHEGKKQAEGITKRNVALERQNRVADTKAIRDDPRFASSLKTGDSAGGSLIGNYPNPTLAANSVGSTTLAPSSINETHFPSAEGIGRVLPSLVSIRRANIPAGTVSLTEASPASFDSRYRVNSVKILETDMGTGSVGVDALKTSEVDSRYRLSSVRISQDGIAVPGVGRLNIADGAVDLQRLDTALQGGDTTAYRLRLLGGSGSSGAGAKSDHSHSLEMKTMEPDLRIRILKLRKEIRQMPTPSMAPTSAESFNKLRQGLLVVMHLLFDEEDHAAEEREWGIATDPEMAEKVRQRNMHEYDGKLEMRRKGRFYVHPHKDIAALSPGSLDDLSSE